MRNLVPQGAAYQSGASEMQIKGGYVLQYWSTI